MLEMRFETRTTRRIVNYTTTVSDSPETRMLIYVHLLALNDVVNIMHTVTNKTKPNSASNKNEKTTSQVKVNSL